MRAAGRGKLKKIRPFLTGILIGLINGIFGAGGGMLAVPALRGEGLPQKRAHAGAVAAVAPLCAVSAGVYALKSGIDYGTALLLLPSGLAGAAAGALLLRKMPDRWLRLIFAGFMIYAGVRLFLS